MKARKILLTLALIFVVQLILINLASALTIKSVDVSSERVVPGGQVEISLSLENNNNFDVTNVEATFNLSSVPFKLVDSSGAFLDKIREYASKSLDFTLQALENAKTGIYNLPITVSYNDDSNRTLTRSTLATLTVNSQPLVSVEREDSTILKGRNSEFSFKVINKGLADVKFLEISVDTNSGYSLLSPNSFYIGDVDSNDFQTAQFKVFVNTNAPNVISVPVTISYKDLLNNQHSQTLNVEVRVYSLKEAQTLGLVKKSNAGTYISIIIFLIVVYIIYRIIRGIIRKRKQRREEEAA